MITDSFRLLKPSRDCREMTVLAEIARDAAISQRGLARAAGISATMINAYVDDLVGRGLLDVTGETNRSYRYHLTDAGRLRHEELHQQMCREVFELYARLKQELRAHEEPAAPPADAPEARSA